MAVQPDRYALLQAEYRTATAQERAEWKVLSDPNLGPVERVKAYARWTAAAEQIKDLSIKMRDVAAPVTSPPR
jgi:hypothetical protein